MSGPNFNGGPTIGPRRNTPDPIDPGVVLDAEEREALRFAAHDGMCPEGPDCRSRYPHAMAYTAWDVMADAVTAAVARVVAERERKARAEAWDEGERHESEYLATWGQFCPLPDCNPYRSDRMEGR